MAGPKNRNGPRKFIKKASSATGVTVVRRNSPRGKAALKEASDATKRVGVSSERAREGTAAIFAAANAKTDAENRKRKKAK